MQRMTRRTKVLVFAPYFPPAYLGGGPIRTLSAMTKNSPDKFIPMVVTSDTDLGEKEPLGVPRNMWSEYMGVSVYYGSRSPLGTIRALHAACRLKPEVVYLSSFFSLRSSIIPQLLLLARVIRPKYVGIAPRGEFGNGALSLKSRKKRIYLELYRRTSLMRRVNWHASSDREASDIVGVVGAGSTVITRENDTDLPLRAHLGITKQTTDLKAIFVGRIVPIKGLLTLIEALKKCEKRVTLDIYGPEEDPEYSQQCRRAATETPKNVVLNFKGSVSNDSVKRLLPEYDVMLFPTLGENFGHVIAEALASSCPVVCADVTPWTERLRNGGGKVVAANTPAGWLEAISTFSMLSFDERARTRRMAAEAYNEWRRGFSGHHIFELIGSEGVRFNS